MYKVQLSLMPLSSSTARVDHYRKTYQLHLARLREELGDEDKAVAATVGGDFAVFGQIEFDLLCSLGLKPNHSVIDVGCGCGRLAYFLREYTRAKYTGVDVIPELVSYCRKVASRDDWEFIVGDGTSIPAEVPPADFICFFSLLTHLTLEDGYRYLLNALKFLKPEGLIVISFLDFTIPDHWPHFLQNVANQTDETVVVQYLSRDTVISWASKLGLKVCAIFDSDRLKIPISKPLMWQNGNVTTGTISIGQSVAVLSLGPNPISESIRNDLGDTISSNGLEIYRELLEATQVKAREQANEQAKKQAEKLGRIRLESAQYAQGLKADIESMHYRMRMLEDELAKEKGRGAALAQSWIPGKLLFKHLPDHDFFRYKYFGDNGADLVGPPITYHLYTSPYRMFDLGINALAGWCFAENEAIVGVRIRLNEAIYVGDYGVSTRTIAQAQHCTFEEARSDGFVLKFNLGAAGRHFLRLEANIMGKGWCTFLSCPIWTLPIASDAT
jgi:SAM-dependent methyltransferase